MDADTIIATFGTILMFALIGLVSFWLNKKFPGKITYQPPRNDMNDPTTPAGHYWWSHHERL